MVMLLAVLWQTTAWVVDNQLLWPHLHLVLIKLIEMLGRVQFLEAVMSMSGGCDHRKLLQHP
jgi:hypothetical protein